MASENLDMIGNLPENLLTNIVSLLPFKEGARTCVLAKRWRHIWRSSKHIGFDQQLSANPDDEFVVKGSNQDQIRGSFMNLAPSWIENYSDDAASIDKFSLTVSTPQTYLEHVTQCISICIERGVKFIWLDFSDSNWNEDDGTIHEANFQLPLDFYDHKTIVSLKLFSCSFLGSEFDSFDCLKELSLGWIRLSSLTLKALIQKCEFLEILSLKKCWNSEAIEITGPNLRLQSLTIDKCDVINKWIFIVAPNMKIFKYSGEICTFEMERTWNIEEAELDFGVESEFSELGEILQNLLRDLSEAKTLTVCSYTLQVHKSVTFLFSFFLIMFSILLSSKSSIVWFQVIPSTNEPLGLRHCLEVRHLILKTAMHENELFGVMFLLKSFHCLETLTIDVNPDRKILTGYESPFKERWTQYVQVYPCVKKTLKVVEVNGFRGDHNTFVLLRYFVNFGAVMEKLNIKVTEEAGHGGSSEVGLHKTQMLQNIEKASPRLQISVSQVD
ncbi:F-box protein At3g62230-like [Humulus lupulus]|uniref:F-box protein At3g62230-like n=1 Tax=Humulus lupulus TaxID=3486 RepID=UPI002B41169A|nr:F-box protein At3g62230-like [Humulus lupulus]